MSTYVEAIVLIGSAYYFFINNNDNSYQESLLASQPSWIAGTQMLGVSIIIAPVMLIAFLVRLIATFIMAIKSPNQTELNNVANSYSEETEVISQYATLIEKITSDIQLIERALKNYNTEVKSLVGDKQSIQQNSGQASQSILTDEIGRAQNIDDDLLQEFQILRQSYPQRARDALPTLDDLDLLSTHHTNVLILVDVMLPNLFSDLNLAKDSPRL